MAQLLAAYSGTSLIGLQRTAAANVHRYGCVAGNLQPARHKTQGGTAGGESGAGGGVPSTDCSSWGGSADISGGGSADINGGGSTDMSGGGSADISGGGSADTSGGGSADTSGGGSKDTSGGGCARLNLTSLVEKPTAEFAKTNMTVPGLAEGTFLTAFGLYVVL